MQKGYIAIASVLVIAAVVTLIGVTVSLSSINEAQVSFANIQGDEALDFAEACADEALYRLKRTGAIQTTFPLLETTCSITIESQVGSNWIFTTMQTVNNHTKKLRVNADRVSGTVTINSWQEV